MNTMTDENFDYPAYTRETPPDPAAIRRGTDARQQRFDAAMMRLAVRVDEDVLQQFQQLAAEGQTAERLINQALREWLSAQNVKELVRAEIQRAVQQSLAAAQTNTTSSDLAA